MVEGWPGNFCSVKVTHRKLPTARLRNFLAAISMPKCSASPAQRRLEETVNAPINLDTIGTNLEGQRSSELCRTKSPRMPRQTILANSRSGECLTCPLLPISRQRTDWPALFLRFSSDVRSVNLC